MTPNEFRVFLNAATVLCVVMALISLVRWRKFGAGALFLSVSFLAMAGLLRALFEGADMTAIVGWSAALCFLLAGDMVMRSRPKA